MSPGWTPSIAAATWADTISAPSTPLLLAHSRPSAVSHHSSNYIADRPQLPTEDTLREHCTAALDIAALAAAQCRRQGIPETELASWDQQVRRVTDVLDGPIRHIDDSGISL